MADNHEWARKLSIKIDEYSKRLSTGNAAFVVLAQESDLLNAMAEAIDCAEMTLREVQKSLKEIRSNLREAEEKVGAAQHRYEARMKGLQSQEEPIVTA